MAFHLSSPDVDVQNDSSKTALTIPHFYLNTHNWKGFLEKLYQKNSCVDSIETEDWVKKENSIQKEDVSDFISSSISWTCLTILREILSSGHKIKVKHTNTSYNRTPLHPYNVTTLQCYNIRTLQPYHKGPVGTKKTTKYRCSVVLV